jgi:carbon-monoxide dehydrogenase large subunit
MIGASPRRREDARLITGRTSWTFNVRPLGCLHVAFLRSPVPHARLTRVDVSGALQARAVVAAFAGESLRIGDTGLVGLFPSAEHPSPVHQPLAIDRVRYPGEAIAVVVARDPGSAVDALEAIDVSFDPLPVVGDGEQALLSTALVHEHIAGNLCYQEEQGTGDVAAAFAAADVVVRRRFALPRVAPAAMEPRCVTVAPEGDGYTVWTSTQTPHIVRHQLAVNAGLPQSAIRVVAGDVGGGFGSKVGAYPEEVVLLKLAHRLGRPVTWTATRSEDLAATVHGRVLVQDVAIAASTEGRMLGLEVALVSDVGAYVSPAGAGSAMFGATMYPGIYQFDAFRLSATGVYTNRTPVGAYRGAGRPEATFAIERIVDELAAALRIDPIELRRRNWITQFPYETKGGETYDVGDYAAATDRALELFDYEGLRAEQQARRQRLDPVQLGIGVSTYTEACGGGIRYAKDARETATVRLLASGQVEATVGTSPFGTGHLTSWSQIVASVLGVALDDVRVIHADTATAPDGFDSYGSRSLVVGGAALHSAATLALEKARALAAEMLEADPRDLQAADGSFRVRGAAGAGVTLRDVDTETGHVRVHRYVAVDDLGTVVNPQIVEGQIHGGVAQGIGEALYEEVAYDGDGNLVTSTFVDLTLPSAVELPRFVTDRTSTPSPATPLGAKGVGEAGAIGSTPAVVNAVHDALRFLGVAQVDVPCTPHRVWRAISDAAQP